jgi:hypothetical protein
MKWKIRKGFRDKEWGYKGRRVKEKHMFFFNPS